MQPTQINNHKRGLLERLDNEGIVCAEGFLFEIERRGLACRVKASALALIVK